MLLCEAPGGHLRLVRKTMDVDSPNIPWQVLAHPEIYDSVGVYPANSKFWVFAALNLAS